MIWFLFVSFDEGCHVTQVYFESALPCVMWGWRQKPGLCASKTSTLSTAPWSQQILSGLGVGRGFSWVGLVLKLLILSNLEDLLSRWLTYIPSKSLLNFGRRHCSPCDVPKTTVCFTQCEGSRQSHILCASSPKSLC